MPRPGQMSSPASYVIGSSVDKPCKKRKRLFINIVPNDDFGCSLFHRSVDQTFQDLGLLLGDEVSVDHHLLFRFSHNEFNRCVGKSTGVYC